MECYISRIETREKKEGDVDRALKTATKFLPKEIDFFFLMAKKYRTSFEWIEISVMIHMSVQIFALYFTFFKECSPFCRVLPLVRVLPLAILNVEQIQTSPI